MVEPYFTNGTATIYHGDCREILPSLTGDLVITSPPYNMNLRITPNRKFISRQCIPDEFSSKYQSYSDDLQPAEYFNLLNDVLTASLEACGHVCWNMQVTTGSKLSLAQLMGAHAESFKELVIWDKGHGQPAMNDRTLNSAAELVIIFDSVDPRTRQFPQTGFGRGKRSNIWRIPRGKRTPGHKATFPEQLVQHCLDLYTNSETVIDPFMGTGTTLKVATENGYKAIGIEMDEQYCEIAAKSLSSISVPLFTMT